MSDVESLLTIDDVCCLLSVSKATVLRLRKGDVKVMDGEKRPMAFPEPKLMIGRSPRWEAAVFHAWLKQSIQ